MNDHLETKSDFKRSALAKIMKRSFLFLLSATLLVSATGCVNVKPWQRKNLADYTMLPDRDPLRVSQAEHIWFSREEASGGRGVGGGGCGCN